MNTGFKSVMTAVTASVFLTLSPLPLQADMQAHIGPLNQLVELGQDGEWTLEDKGGWFTMTNTKLPTRSNTTGWGCLNHKDQTMWPR